MPTYLFKINVEFKDESAEEELNKVTKKLDDLTKSYDCDLIDKDKNHFEAEILVTCSKKVKNDAIPKFNTSKVKEGYIEIYEQTNSKALHDELRPRGN